MVKRFLEASREKKKKNQITEEQCLTLANFSKVILPLKTGNGGMLTKYQEKLFLT